MKDRRLCTAGAADRGVPSGVTVGAKVEAGLRVALVRHGDTEGLLGWWVMVGMKGKPGHDVFAKQS